MADQDQVFSEKQASDILQKAARMQEERGGAAGSYAPGLSYDEMLRIASEAGIDPKYLEEAIQTGGQSKERKFFNLVEEEERIVDGELDMADFDVILDVAKPTRTRRYPPTQVGRTFSMRTNYKGGYYAVEVTSRNGRTRVNVKSLPLLAYLMSLHPAILLAFFGSANLGAQGVNVGAILFAVGSILAGALGFMALVGRSKSKTGELTDRIASKIRETTHDVRANLASSTASLEPSEAQTVPLRTEER